MPTNIVMMCLGVLLFSTVSLANDQPIGLTRIAFPTRNLSVYRFMIDHSTFPGPPLSNDWASPEPIAQLKLIGVMGDCDYEGWSMVEPRPKAGANGSRYPPQPTFD